MRFADPWALALLPVVGLYLWLRWPRARRPPAAYLAFPWLALLDDAASGPRARWARLPLAFRAAALALGIVALARPQAPSDVRDVKIRGRNIIVALDISSSMRAVDLGPGSRLDVAKRVLARFLERRQGDLVGLVIFSGSAFTQAPLTVDTPLLLKLLDRVEIGLLPDGTAIGTALAMSLTHLQNLPARSSVVVLLTDGINNAGEPDPLTAAGMARALGIRVYTIGVSTGSPGPGAAAQNAVTLVEARPDRPLLAWYNNKNEAALPSAIDEGVLQTIAAATGGQYFRAADPAALERIVNTIDRLEKATLHVREVGHWRELFAWFLGPAVLLLGLELASRATWLGTLP